MPLPFGKVISPTVWHVSWTYGHDLAMDGHMSGQLLYGLLFCMPGPVTEKRIDIRVEGGSHL